MVRSVDPDDLVDSSQVAELLGLASAGAVRVYRSRYDDFPAPVVARGRCVLWIRSEIVSWATSR